MLADMSHTRNCCGICGHHDPCSRPTVALVESILLKRPGHFHDEAHHHIHRRVGGGLASPAQG